MSDTNEFITALFTDDPDNEESYYRTNLELDGEKLLWWEVLKAALEDYKENVNANKSVDRLKFIEAFDWFYNEHQSSYIGSYENICDMFAIDAFYLRKYLILWTKTNYDREKISKGRRPEIEYLNLQEI